MRRGLPVLPSGASARMRQGAADSVHGGVLAASRAGAQVAGGADVRAGSAAAAAAMAVAEEAGGGASYPGTELWAALREVDDPEFPVSVVDLGLVVDVRRRGRRVEVDLTYTATACPCMEFIRQDVRERLLREPGVGEVEVRDVWQPAWTRARMTAEGRATLRRFGVA